MIRQRLMHALLAMGLLGLVACATPPESDSEKQAVDATAVLRIGVSPTASPILYREAGLLKGLEMDLAHAVAKELGQRPEFVELSRDALMAALQADRIDVAMAGFTITPALEEQAALTDSYLRMGQMAIIRAADVVAYQAPLRAIQRGARVGFVSGSAGEDYVKSLSVVRRQRAYTDVETALEALEAGEVDIVIHDAATSWDLSVTPHADKLMSLYRPLTDERLAWAVRRDNDRLREQLNTALATLRGSGKLEVLVYRWIPVQVHLGEPPARSAP